MENRPSGEASTTLFVPWLVSTPVPLAAVS